MNETYTTIHGNAVEDPVRHLTRAGAPYVTFRLASTESRRRADSGEFYDVGTSFYQVTAYRQLARNVDRSVRKGQPVIVHGKLRLREWTDGDRRGTSAELDATSVGTDLRRGTAVFTRVTGATTRGVTSFGGPGGDAFERAAAAGFAPESPVGSSGPTTPTAQAPATRADLDAHDAATDATVDTGEATVVTGDATEVTGDATEVTADATVTAAPHRLAG